MTKRREAAQTGPRRRQRQRESAQVVVARPARVWPPRQRAGRPTLGPEGLTMISMPTSSSLTARLSTVKGAKGWSAAVAA